MGVINFGNQIITFAFGEEARSKNWNKLSFETIPAGIYSGGLLSLAGVNQVDVAPLTCYIDDNNSQLSVNVQTTSTVTLVVAPSTPYIVLRMTWINATGVYMDFFAIDYLSLQPTDLIVGKAVYVNGIIQSFFDYTLRNDALPTTFINRNSEFLVKANDGSPNSQVQVSAGTFITNKKFVTVAAGASPALTNTTLGRIDLIYIDDTGAIQKTEGVDSASPTTPNYHGKLVVAEVHRGASRTDVQSQDIILINFSRYVIGSMSIDSTLINWGTSGLQINANLIPIVSTIFGTATVENALQVIATASHRSSFIAAGSISSGKLVVASQNGIKQFSTTPQIGTAYNLPNNTTEMPANSSVLFDTGKVFIVFQDSTDTGKLKGVVATIASDNSVSYGTPVTIDASLTGVACIFQCWVYKLTSTSVIICYETLVSHRYLILIACSISGTTITVGSPITPTGAQNLYDNLLGFGLYDSTHALIVYADYSTVGSNASFVTCCNLITISGISLTSGSQKSTIDSNGFFNPGVLVSPNDVRNEIFIIGNDAYVFYPTLPQVSGANFWTDYFIKISLISSGTDLSTTVLIGGLNNPGIAQGTATNQGPARNPLFGSAKTLCKNYAALWCTSLIPQSSTSLKYYEQFKFIRYSNGSFVKNANFTQKLIDIAAGVTLPSTADDLTAGLATTFSIGMYGAPIIVDVDSKTFIIVRYDTNGNAVSLLYYMNNGEIPYVVDIHTFKTNISANGKSRPNLCKIDKTRFLLTYGDALDGDKVKSAVVEFLDIPSSILGIATQTVIAGQSCIVDYSKLIGGLSGLSVDAAVYPAADGTPTSTATINIPIGKALTSTQMITNIMSSVIAT